MIPLSVTSEVSLGKSRFNNAALLISLSHLHLQVVELGRSSIQSATSSVGFLLNEQVVSQ